MNSTQDLSSLANKASTRFALVVVDDTQGLDWGAMIALVLENHRIVFYVNHQAIVQKGIQVHDSVTRFARLLPKRVHTHPRLDRSLAHLQMIIRILHYDQNIKSRLQNRRTFGILHDPKSSRSVQAAQRIARMLTDQVLKEGLFGHPVEVVVIPTGDRDYLEKVLSSGLFALYFAEQLDPQDVRKTIPLTRKLQITSVTSEQPYMKLGISLGVSEQGNRPILIINPSAAKQEGTRFSSQVLKLARIVDATP